MSIRPVMGSEDSRGVQSGRGPLQRPLRAPFPQSLLAYLALWPVWWGLGVEQLLAPVWIGFVAIRHFVRSRGKMALRVPVKWAGLLAVWWLVPLAYLDPEYYDIFLKEFATALSQVLFLILIIAQVRTMQGWNRVLDALCVFAALMTIGGLVCATGVWRDHLTSAIGYVLPASLESSTFFSSITSRSFGILSPWGLFLWRIRSFFLHPNSLSMFALLLIPLVSWRAATAKVWSRAAYILLAIGLLACLVGTESRISWVAFAVGVSVFVLYLLSRLGWRRFLLVCAFAIALAVVLVARFVDMDRVVEFGRDLLATWRPGSMIVRTKVYRVTFEMLSEHLVAGWGVQIQQPDVPSSFSAGSHSSVLAMLFRHGIVGLLIYVGLWASIWREVIGGLRQRAASKEARWFWVAAALALLSFNIRELADVWWWDQALTITVWSVWGLVVTARGAGFGEDAVRASPMQESCPQTAKQSPYPEQ